LYSSETGKKDSWILHPADTFLISYGIIGTAYRNTISIGNQISFDQGNHWLNKLGENPITVTNHGTAFATEMGSIIRLVDSARMISVSGLPFDISGQVPFKLLPTGDTSLWYYGFFSKDNGLSWDTSEYAYRYLIPGYGTDLLIQYGDSLGQSTIGISTDNAEHWQYSAGYSHDNRIGAIGERGYNKPFVIDVGGVYHHSEDGGTTWGKVEIYPGVYFDQSGVMYVKDSLSLYYIYLGEIFFSKDGGESWTHYVLPDYSSPPVHLTSAADGALLAIINHKLVRSTNDGFTWDLFASGISGQPNDITHDINGSVYVATSKGVYVLFPGEKAWRKANTGLTDSNVLSITSLIGKTLFAATSHSKIYRADLFPSGVIFSEHSKADLTIAPNPAFDEFTLTIPSEDKISNVDFFDMLGSKVFIPVIIHGNTASANVDFIPAGYYFSRVSGGKKVYLSSFIVRH
jgi:hypothetical protein